MDWELVQKLMNCFDRSFINQHGEFIVNSDTNDYFILKSCKDEMDIKCKVIEWLSRSAIKGSTYRSENRNLQYQDFILKGINKFLGTDFSKKDMEQVYTYLGNACNHNKTIDFIQSNYDLDLLIK